MRKIEVIFLIFIQQFLLHSNNAFRQSPVKFISTFEYPFTKKPFEFIPSKHSEMRTITREELKEILMKKRRSFKNSPIEFVDKNKLKRRQKRTSDFPNQFEWISNKHKRSNHYENDFRGKLKVHKYDFQMSEKKPDYPSNKEKFSTFDEIFGKNSWITDLAMKPSFTSVEIGAHPLNLFDGLTIPKMGNDQEIMENSKEKTEKMNFVQSNSQIQQTNQLGKESIKKEEDDVGTEKVFQMQMEEKGGVLKEMKENQDKKDGENRIDDFGKINEKIVDVEKDDSTYDRFKGDQKKITSNEKIDVESIKYRNNWNSNSNLKDQENLSVELNENKEIIKSKSNETNYNKFLQNDNDNKKNSNNNNIDEKSQFSDGKRNKFNKFDEKINYNKNKNNFVEYGNKFHKMNNLHRNYEGYRDDDYDNSNDFNEFDIINNIKLDELQQTLVERKYEYEEWLRRLKELDSDNKPIDQILLKKVNRLKILKQSIRDRQMKLNKDQNFYFKIKSEIDMIKKDLEPTNMEIDDIRREIERATGYLEEREKYENEAENTYRRISANNKNLGKKIYSLKNQLKVKKDAIRQLHKESARKEKLLEKVQNLDEYTLKDYQMSKAEKKLYLNSLEQINKLIKEKERKVEAMRKAVDKNITPTTFMNNETIKNLDLDLMKEEDTIRYKKEVKKNLVTILNQQLATKGQQSKQLEFLQSIVRKERNFVTTTKSELTQLASKLRMVRKNLIDNKKIASITNGSLTYTNTVLDNLVMAIFEKYNEYNRLNMTLMGKMNILKKLLLSITANEAKVIGQQKALDRLLIYLKNVLLIGKVKLEQMPLKGIKSVDELKTMRAILEQNLKSSQLKFINVEKVEKAKIIQLLKKEKLLHDSVNPLSLTDMKLKKIIEKIVPKFSGEKLEKFFNSYGYNRTTTLKRLTEYVDLRKNWEKVLRKFSKKFKELPNIGCERILNDYEYGSINEKFDEKTNRSELIQSIKWTDDVKEFDGNISRLWLHLQSHHFHRTGLNSLKVHLKEFGKKKKFDEMKNIHIYTEKNENLTRVNSRSFLRVPNVPHPFKFPTISLIHKFEENFTVQFFPNHTINWSYSQKKGKLIIPWSVPSNQLPKIKFKKNNLRRKKLKELYVNDQMMIMKFHFNYIKNRPSCKRWKNDIGAQVQVKLYENGHIKYSPHIPAICFFIYNAPVIDKEYAIKLTDRSYQSLMDLTPSHLTFCQSY